MSPAFSERYFLLFQDLHLKLLRLCCGFCGFKNVNISRDVSGTGKYIHQHISREYIFILVRTSQTIPEYLRYFSHRYFKLVT